MPNKTTWTLVDDSGKEYHIGDSVTSFRGESATIEGFDYPHKAGATGRVYTTLGRHYASVYGLKYKLESQPET